MSTDWGFHCPKHGDSTEHWLNHGEDHLRRLWAAREELQAVLDLQSQLDVEVTIEAWWFAGIAIRWMSDHIDCPVVLESEYGDRIPVEPIPACDNGIKVGDGEALCDLGHGHWGRHRHRDHRVLVEW